jgi:hypothetical protein
MTKSTQILTALLAASACGTQEADWAPRSIQNEGQICLFTTEAAASDPFDGEQETQQYQADEPVFVRFVAHTCLSSSCSRNATSACAASQSGATITVTADATWDANVAQGAACTADCGILSDACETGALDAGTYQVVFGTLQQELTVPSSVQTVCLETPR